ncbi:MAG: hypothetical protein MI724_02535 [Spirochaetales bacterium]|nr:hypothetical protein [Spirochaetales bacterium]
MSRTATFAALVGAIAPDLPLFALTLWYWARYGFGFGPEYDLLYFNDPMWIVGHSLFHAPVISLLFIAAAATIRRLKTGTGTQRTAVALRWFGISTLLHTAIDVPTHYHDGPLIFFPFDWTFRIQAPVSYWDPAHHGVPMTIFGFTLDIALLAVWIRWWRRGRKAGTTLETVIE